MAITEDQQKTRLPWDQEGYRGENRICKCCGSVFWMSKSVLQSSPERDCCSAECKKKHAREAIAAAPWQGEPCDVCGGQATEPLFSGNGQVIKDRAFCAPCAALPHARRKRLQIQKHTHKMAGKVPSSTVGAVSEIIACADLLQRGYAVFRSVSPACPCDVIAMGGGGLHRVEVKTWAPSASSSKGSHVVPKAPGSYDVLAVVDLVCGDVQYTPSLDDLLEGVD